MVTTHLSNMVPGNQRLIRPDAAVCAFAEAEMTGVVNNADIWAGSGAAAIQPEPDTGGYALFVKSSAATDNLTGVGTRTVEIHYLDTTGVEQTVSVDLNGVTEVDSGVTDCMFVQRHHATAVGSTLVSVGDVDCLAGSGGAVVSRILTAGNHSLSTMFQVPAGKKLIITGWLAAGVASTVKIATLRLRASAHNQVSAPGIYHFINSTRVKDFAGPWIPMNKEIPALACVKISAWTDGTISLSAQWCGQLENV